MAAYQYIYVMKGLSKIYPGGRKVLENIWLSFLPGAKIGVLGHNGAGKSTLLKIMAGIDKDVGGEAWAADGASVGYLPQEPQLDLAKDVLGNVMEGMAATKALLSAICLLVVGGLWGGVLSVPGAILALAVLFLAALGFAAQGMLCTAYAKSFEAFSYFFTFWTTPMFVFSGVFFSLERFPPAIATAAWLLPMPHVIALVRPLTTGAGLSLLPAVGHLLWLGVLFVVPYLLAVRRIRARMFD